jgi:SAM-dependent methyltransferase
MPDTYQDKYALCYDLIYRDKDYEAECDFVEEIFQEYSPHPIATVLELGCGTGGHAIPLAQKGYKVCGIDISEAMIARARKKAKDANLKLDFQLMDLRSFNFDRNFDACISMFAVMGYVTGTKDLLSTLRNVRKHLVNASLFVFDFWNGLAVLRILPSVRVKTIENGEIKIIRIAEPELDAFNHLCQVHYHLLVIKDNTLTDEFKETHVVRYFFPQEIMHYLWDSGFEVLKICPFLDLSGKVDENVWNITVIARAV